MLYEIHLPKDKDKVAWILSLQQRLLRAVCVVGVSPSKVNVSWLKRLFFDVEPKWVVEKLATVKDRIDGNKKTLIQNIKEVAKLPTSIKKKLYEDFKHDLQFDRAYSLHYGVFQIRGLTALDGQPIKVRRAFRGLLECFYAPVFYKQCGYRITDSSGNVSDFCKDDYLESYNSSNLGVRVCPFCDSLDESPQLDHYIKKSSYPGLSCHPLNLVPICGNCNKGENKGQKLVFNKSASDPWADWLHPYLRPAYGLYKIKIQKPNGSLQPTLVASNGLAQRQLNNYVKLIRLDIRWRNQMKRKVALTERKIDDYRKDLGRKPTEAELLGKLQEWANSAATERGIEPYSLIDHVYLSEAAKKNPDIFPELWKYSQNDITP